MWEGAWTIVFWNHLKKLRSPDLPCSRRQNGNQGTEFPVDYSSKQIDIPYGWNYPGVGQAACWGGKDHTEAGHHHEEGHQDRPALCERFRHQTNCWDYLEESRFISSSPRTSFHVTWVLWGPEQNYEKGKPDFSITFLSWMWVNEENLLKDVNALICQSTFWKRVPQESTEQIYCWVCSTVPFGGSDSKESACNAGDLGLIPGLERFPGEGNSYLFQYFEPGEFHRQRSLVGYSPWGHKESDTTEQLSLSLFTIWMGKSSWDPLINQPTVSSRMLIRGQGNGMEKQNPGLSSLHLILNMLSYWLVT